MKFWSWAKTTESPYLKDTNRLGDVIAAIQVMATYRYYKLPHDGWADRIAANEDINFRAQRWKKLFKEHPEFFRLDSAGEKASLVWRRQFPKRYDVDTGKLISLEQYEGLTEPKKLRVSRTPLQSSDIKALIDTAVNLHSRALEHQKDRRWWVPLVASAGGGLIGSVVGSLLK